MRPARTLAIMISVLAALGIGTVALAAPSSGAGLYAGWRSGAAPSDLGPGDTITPTATLTTTNPLTGTNPLTSTMPVSGSNKVADAIAKYFGVEVTEIVQMHTEGMGFGSIVIALNLANASGKPIDEILAMREAGEGWGKISKELEIHPGKWGTNLGQMRSGKATPIVKTAPVVSATPPAGGVISPTLKTNGVAPNTGKLNGNGNGYGNGSDHGKGRK